MVRTRASGGRARQAEQQELLAHRGAHVLAELEREVRRTRNDDDDGPAVKKRRVAGRLVVQGEDETKRDEEMAKQEDELSNANDTASSARTPEPEPKQQIVFDDDRDEDDDGDEASYSESEQSDWEDVDLDTTSAAAAAAAASITAPEPKDLALTLSGPSAPKPSPSRRRPALTASDRQLRLALHKLHVLCLTYHAAQRNKWCNDAAVQSAALKALPGRAREYLHDDPSESQFQRARSLTEGLEMAVEAFGQRFAVSARGLSRARWAAGPDTIADLDMPDDAELPLLREDLVQAAKDMSASRDVGAQVFCAMLRGAGVDARLVASLQVLPLGSAASATQTAAEARAAAPTVLHGETRTDITPDSKKKKKKKKSRPESKFPAYWVEAFSPAHQKWIAVDPLVTCTVGKPSRLEPPAADAQNQLVYALAFDGAGYARDVTRRYTRAFNAKTRRARVEATKGGAEWWAGALRTFARRRRRDRDNIEDAQLAAKAAQEPMPRAVADFKGHPVYALERHLRRNQVLHPRRAIGKVEAGRGAVEDVFRRGDVHLVRSADAWFREGREVRADAQALKTGKPRRTQRPFDDDDDGEPEERPGVPLFAHFQTEAYAAPPVVRGRVPRNVFGNLDVYVPGMIPPGGAHVRHAAVARAARLLGVDYADAVTGFEFRGRTGSAVVLGAVVPEEAAEAVRDVVVGFAELEWRERMDKRREGVLGMWVRFLKALRIRERVRAYAEDDEEESEEDSDEYVEDDGSADDGSEHGQGAENRGSEEQQFVPPAVEIVRAVAAKPEASKEEAPTPARKAGPDIADEGGFLPDAGGFVTDDAGGGFVAEGSRGGFLPEPAQAGGFAPGDDVSLADAASAAGSMRTDEAEEVQMAFALEESAREAAEAEKAGGPDPMDSEDTGGVKAEAEAEAEAAAEAAEQVPVPEAKREGSESSDKGSLLSHDPEDEDADPDWLM